MIGPCWGSRCSRSARRRSAALGIEIGSSTSMFGRTSPRPLTRGSRTADPATESQRRKVLPRQGESPRAEPLRLPQEPRTQAQSLSQDRRQEQVAQDRENPNPQVICHRPRRRHGRVREGQPRRHFPCWHLCCEGPAPGQMRCSWVDIARTRDLLLRERPLLTMTCVSTVLSATVIASQPYRQQRQRRCSELHEC